MNSRDEQLTWAKQRALICVGVGRFADAVAGLRADLDKGAMSSEHAMRGYKAASDAALGRGSQALTEWIEGLRLRDSRDEGSKVEHRSVCPERARAGLGDRLNKAHLKVNDA